MKQVALALGAVIWAPSLLAHEVHGLSPHHFAQAWSPQAWLWLLWGVPGLFVLAGIARLWKQAGVGAGVRRLQSLCFLAGWLSLGMALLSPIDALGEVLFSVHMVQHEIMMVIAAPLLVLARPLGPMVWGLPAAWRPGAAALTRVLGLQAATRWLTWPVVAWCVHAVALWAWHLPALFDAALRTPWIHDLQHTSFFVSALVFWWAVFQGHGGASRVGGALISLFTTLMHTSALGALLALSSQLWYGAYAETAPAWGLGALEDQQLGGVIMWVPASAAYLAAALVLMAQWLRASDAGGRTWAAAAREH